MSCPVQRGEDVVGDLQCPCYDAVSATSRVGGRGQGACLRPLAVAWQGHTVWPCGPHGPPAPGCDTLSEKTALSGAVCPLHAALGPEVPEVTAQTAGPLASWAQ